MYLQVNKKKSFNCLLLCKNLYLFQNFILTVYSYINYQIYLLKARSRIYIEFYIRII